MIKIKIQPLTDPERYQVILPQAREREICSACRGTGSAWGVPETDEQCTECRGEGTRVKAALPTVLACYSDPRVAKAFRNALDVALNEQRITSSKVAMLFAAERAKAECRCHLETSEPDQHFLPA